MCGCNDPCKVARCPGCPETDWSSFTFRADQPASLESKVYSTVERRFDAVSTAMKYPGDCPCAWLHYVGDYGRDISGAYNENTLFFPIASISRLERIRSGTGFTWQYSIARYNWDWTYWQGLGFAPGSGWNWNEHGPFGDSNGCVFGWGHGWGFGRWGYGGWGGGNYAWGFDPSYWYIGFGSVARYSLDGPFRCQGTSHFIRNDAFYAAQEEYDGDAFPAFVDITRIPRDTVFS